ncbi:WYL domain-containing protein [Gordonia terrae]|uniref:WYL domain-containing protein n=1 Tax=Gordonia terrae TaxID=2055 RepID=UPI003F6BFCE1
MERAHQRRRRLSDANHRLDGGQRQSRRCSRCPVHAWYGRGHRRRNHSPRSGRGTLRRRFLPRELPDPDPITYVANSIRTTPYRYTARAIVSAPAETIAARLNSAVPGRVRPLNDHTCTVTLGADSPEPIAADLIALSAPFTLDAPPELLDNLHTLADRLAAATRPPDIPIPVA